MASKKSTKTNKKKSTKKKKVSSKASGKESRDDHRVPIQLLVDYKADGSYLFDFCKDLGTGGIFIETAAPLPQGSDIDLTFTIPDSKETLNTKGQVIWVQNVISGRKDLTPGMGVQFSKFGSGDRKLLEDFVTRYHGKKMFSDDKATKQSA